MKDLNAIREAMTEMFFTARELADRWRLDVQTLANQRARGEGVAFVKLQTGKVLYRVSDVIAYEEAGVNGLTIDKVLKAIRSCPSLGELDLRRVETHMRKELVRVVAPVQHQ